MARRMKENDAIIGELIAIKKLLLLALLKEGLTQSQIGTALGIDQSQISRLIPAALIKPKKSKRKS